MAELQLTLDERDGKVQKLLECYKRKLRDHNRNKEQYEEWLRMKKRRDDDEARRRADLEALKKKLDEYEREREELRKKAEEEEAERLRLIKIAEEEAIRIKHQKLELEAAERERLRIKAEEEEKERLRLKRLAEEEAEQLLRRLKIIEEEEADRKKKKHDANIEHMKTMKIKQAELEVERLKSGGAFTTTTKTYTVTQPVYLDETDEDITITEQIAAFGDADLMGITEDEVDAQCDELFDTPPIKFKPRKNEVVDQLIQGYIKSLGIKVPVVWIKGNLYLIGSQRLNCELRADQLVVRVGGGYQLFEEYVS